MTMRTNRTFSNFVAGELSPLMYGRIDLDTYQKGLRKCENAIILPQGGYRFRTGTKFVKYTRRMKTAVFIPFQFSDQQSYLIELTEFYARFYKDNGVILEGAKTITGITAANPPVVTSASHGYSNGDEVYISGVAGMTEVNGKYYVIANKTTNTFELQDVEGNNIDGSGFTAYSSGGEVSRVYEIATPWSEDHLPYVQFAQSTDTMYLVNQNYKPQKLTRKRHTDWTLATYTRTSDPFAPTKTGTITAITKANPGVVTCASHGLKDGEIVNIIDVVGMTQVNNRVYVVTNKTTNTFELYDLYGEKVDTSGYSTYTSDGTFNTADKYPRCIAFTGAGRLFYGYTRTNPETLWGSKAPSTGTTAYENHTTGTSATDAVVFTLAPEFNGKTDPIQWLSSTSKFLAIGCFGTVRRAYGATEQEGITPTGFNAKSVNSYGCAATLPISNGASFFYVQRGNENVRSLDYDIQIENYTTTNRNLVAEHISRTGIGRIIEQQGFPDLIWAVRNDGKLAGLTYSERENISGWHRHYLGGSHVNDDGVTKPWAKVIHIGSMPRESGGDQLWLIVEREINGSTVRSIEYVSDEPDFPDRADFFTGKDPDNETTDNDKYRDTLYEVQKDSIHLDMSSTYDGADYSDGITMTPGATAVTKGSTDVVFTAGSAVFTSSMVGREIWKKYDSNGDGGGKARITEYTSSTSVKCKILSAFDSASAIAAGGWMLTSDSISGLDHLEGETVGIIADGGRHEETTVTDGAVTLNEQASKVHVGLPYTAVIDMLNVDPGGQTGSAQAKNRIVYKLAIRLKHSLGLNFGTTPYNTENLSFMSGSDLSNRPTPLFSGAKIQYLDDSHMEDEKRIVIVKDTPTPLTILSIDMFMVTHDDD